MRWDEILTVIPLANPISLCLVDALLVAFHTYPSSKDVYCVIQCSRMMQCKCTGGVAFPTAAFLSYLLNSPLSHTIIKDTEVPPWVNSFIVLGLMKYSLGTNNKKDTSRQCEFDSSMQLVHTDCTRTLW